MKKKILTVTVALLLVFLYMLITRSGERPDVPEESPQPETVTLDPVEATPEPTFEQIPEIAPEPKTSWTLAFAGDCTIGTHHEWQGVKDDYNMLWVIGEDYSYPFAKVAETFAAADFAMVNLEGTLTERTETRNKKYCFRAHPRYAETLVLANIDAVSLANNHSGDYLQQGLEDTRAALDEKNILWADDSRPLITELEGGVKLGIVAHNNVETDLTVGDVDRYMERIAPQYKQCEEAGCDVIIGFVHWGWEYTAGPEDWMVDLAHRMAELGFDMIIGSHAHVLQETEVYQGVPIFYSMGNFCFGGNSNPGDKDSVIVLQTLERNGEGKVVLGETEFLPCSISGRDDQNDFQPRLLGENEAGYERALEKLKADEYFSARGNNG